MSENPYASGAGSQDIEPTPQVEAKVGPPAIALLVAGILNVLFGLWGVASSLMMIAGVYPGMAQQREQLEKMQAEMGENPFIDFAMQMQDLQQNPLMLVWNVIGLTVAVVIIVGAIKMKSLKSYGLSMTASILCIVPVFTCCCYGVPIGIWALVVLLKADVKRAFRR